MLRELKREGTKIGVTVQVLVNVCRIRRRHGLISFPQAGAATYYVWHQQQMLLLAQDPNYLCYGLLRRAYDLFLSLVEDVSFQAYITYTTQTFQKKTFKPYVEQSKVSKSLIKATAENG